MKRFFAIIILIVILISICSFEEIFLNNFLTPFTNQANELFNTLKTTENIDNEEINTKYNNLNSNWQNSKTTMCFFTNYEKIKAMDESFIKLQSAIKTNDKNLANENMALICNYKQFFNYMMGFNINNLF